MKRVLFLSIFLVWSLLTQAQSHTDNIPENGLIGFWGFTDGDVSSSNHGLETALYNAKSSDDRFGSTNASYLFDTIKAGLQQRDNEIIVTFDERLNSKFLSVFVWVKPVAYYWQDNQDHRSSIISRWGGGLSGKESFYIDLLSNGKLAVGLHNGVSLVEDISSDITLNNWSFVGFTYDGQTIKQYVNGTMVKSTLLSITINKSDSPMTIGDRHQGNGHSYYWIGNIDDVAYYNRVLSALEVKNMYDGKSRDTLNSIETLSSRQGTCKIHLNEAALRTFDWSGDCSSGFANGKGELEVYENDGLLFTFIGIIKNGDILYGKMKYASGTLDSGQFENGFLTGRGKRIYEDGGKYLGEFENGVKDGMGYEKYPNGDSFIGKYTSDYKQDGKLHMKGGNYYLGTFMRTTDGGDKYWNGVLRSKASKLLETYTNGVTVSEQVTLAETQRKAIIDERFIQILQDAWQKGKGIWGNTNYLKLIKANVSYVQDIGAAKKVCFWVTYSDLWGKHEGDWSLIINDPWFDNLQQGCEEILHKQAVNQITESGYKEHPWKDGAQIGLSFNNKKRVIECLKNHDKREIYYNVKEDRYEIYLFANYKMFSSYDQALKDVLERMKCD